MKRVKVQMASRYIDSVDAILPWLQPVETGKRPRKWRTSRDRFQFARRCIDWDVDPVDGISEEVFNAGYAAWSIGDWSAAIRVVVEDPKRADELIHALLSRMDPF
jgi:hypothetical protein